MTGKVSSINDRQKSLKMIAIISMVFGLVTIVSGGKSLFTDVGSAAAGNYVPFVLWFNFLAGFFYVGAGIGLVGSRKWSWKIAAFIAAATTLVFILFGIHVFTGGAFESRTVFAMVLRSGFWLMVARLSYLRFNSAEEKESLQ